MRVAGVIPARWDSSRFPGKPLVDMGGKPLVQWVYERSLEASELDEIIIATDDERIKDAATGFGAQVVMTQKDHPSGTDRVAEAIQGLAVDAAVNIQGDEPAISPDLINEVSAALKRADCDMVSAAVLIEDLATANNPGVVKVVMDAKDCALYFSRATIPFFRDASPEQALKEKLYYRHIGIYGYTTALLKQIVSHEPTALEEAEKLEQLRALHLGARIKMIKTKEPGPGVDTPEDIPLALEALKNAGLI